MKSQHVALLILFLVAFPAGSLLSQTKPNAPKVRSCGNCGGLLQEIAALRKGLTEVKKELAKTKKKQSVPIGTVIAYAGSLKSLPKGWMHCDGTLLNAYEHKKLWKILGVSHGGSITAKTFRLPDYRGRFLRGVSGDQDRDPEKSKRLAMYPGGNKGNKVGTVQGHATAKPSAIFHIVGTTHRAGGHTHKYIDHHNHHPHNTPKHVDTSPNEAGLRVANNPSTAKSGVHTHTLGGKVSHGGDPETRPKNVYVYWLIKAK